MATEDLITELNTDLNNAFTSIEGKGGTIPPNKNSNNLASSIETIPAGGSTPQYPYDIPEFDGGQYGAIAYLDANNEVAYYTATSETDIAKTPASSPKSYPTQGWVVKIMEDGYEVTSRNLLAYAFGSETEQTPTNFLMYCHKLQNIYGLQHLTRIGNTFLYGCYSFNQPITIPTSVKSIGNSFLSYCYSFNQPITIPSSVTSIGTNFLDNCQAFNQSITIPNSVTSVGKDFMYNCNAFNQPITLSGSLVSIGNDFLENCYSFNQPITIPNSVKSIGSNFLYNCYSFNQPITIPDSVNTIGSLFLNTCTAFNQPIIIPDSVTTIQSSFLYNCYSFNQPITIPSSVTSIGTNFMYNCLQSIHPITVNTSAHPTDTKSLAAEVNTGPSYVSGFTLAGPYAQAWKDALPDSTSNPYRKLVIATLPEAPDLSEPLTAQQYNDLKEIVRAGEASANYNEGDTILVSYGDYTMPFVITGFEPVTTSTGNKPAINLLAKNVTDSGTTWGDNGTQPYSQSNLRDFIANTLESKLDPNFLAGLGTTEIKTYSRDGATDTVYDKLFAPSMAELGVTNTSYNTAEQAAVEGPAFTSYNGASNSDRKKTPINGNDPYYFGYWTRSLYTGGANMFGYIGSMDGYPNHMANNIEHRVLLACNFTG